MRISFILPSNVISGGHRIIYELASRLSINGHRVAVYYPVLPPAPHWKVKGLSQLKGLARSVQRQLAAPPPGWMEVKIPVRKVPWISPYWVPNADVLVAPHWDVACALRRFPLSKGRKVYYMHHPTRSGRAVRDREFLWDLDYFRIVVNKRLLQVARSQGFDAEYVPNAIDPSIFRVIKPFESRDASTVAMLYSNTHWKAVEEGLEVLENVRREDSRLHVLLFGVATLKHRLPPWVEWCGALSTRGLVDRIYNRAAIFLCTSHYESWALPPFEAMACGCAVVSTEHDGSHEYADHKVSALLAPIGDTTMLTQHILRLMSDNALRIKIAKQGMEAVRRFSWEKTMKLFEGALYKALEEH